MLEPKKEVVKRIVPSPKPFYVIAGFWIIAAQFLRMYKFSSWLILAVISLVAYFIMKKTVFPDEEVLEEVATANTYFSELQKEFIENGTKSLSNIIQINKQIDNPQLNQDVDELVNTTDQILDYVYEHANAASSLRKLTNYYLPTVEKLLSRYDEVEEQTAENVVESKQKVESIIKTTSEAFKNQLKSLFDTDTLDINSEVKVLEQIYIKEGLIDPENK